MRLIKHHLGGNNVRWEVIGTNPDYSVFVTTRQLFNRSVFQYTLMCRCAAAHDTSGHMRSFAEWFEPKSQRDWMTVLEPLVLRSFAGVMGAAEPPSVAA